MGALVVAILMPAHYLPTLFFEDSDLRACCSESGPLFHVDSIAEIISQATVTQELIDDVNSVNIRSVNVFEQQKQTFTCETRS